MIKDKKEEKEEKTKKTELKIVIDTRRTPNAVINYAEIINSTSLSIQNIEKYDITVSKDNNAVIHYPSEEENYVNTDLLILKIENINIDFGNDISFQNIQELFLINSISKLKALPKTLYLKGDINKINANLHYFSSLNQTINHLILKIQSFGNIPINLNELFLYEVMNKANTISLSFNGKIIYDKTIKISNAILDKIISLHINNCIDVKEIISLFSKCQNLIEFKTKDLELKDIKPILEIPSLQKINVEDYPNELAPKSVILYELDELNVNYHDYNIEKLQKIVLPLFEFSKKENTVLLYGEANLEFYNEKNIEFIKKITEINNKSFRKVQFLNFDIENIDYLSKLVLFFDNINKVVFDNLNINENFVNSLSKQKIFNAKHLTINNITFLSEEAEENFYSFINQNLFKSVKLKNVESLNKYEIIIKKSEKLLFSEILEIDYQYLSENLCLSNLLSLQLIKIDIDPNGEESEKLQNQKLILKLIQKNQSTLSKLKLDLEIDTNFLFTELGKLTFPNLTFLSIVIDENISQKDKVDFLLTSSKSFPKLTFIQFELYSISKSTTQMILSKYPLLQEIQ